MNTKINQDQAALRHGIPRRGEYAAMLKSDLFRRCEDFSSQYLDRNQALLRDYAQRWIADPLHQWSRQWEYPYVASQIFSHIESDSFRVLDAGSGATFFPFFVASKDERIQMTCCDRDPSLPEVYSQLNRVESAEVDFALAELSELPFETDSFDALCCISVLEHTENYDAIVKEFRRVLKPMGKLIVTFDISISGRADVPLDRAASLLKLLVDGKNDQSNYPEVYDEVAANDFVTSGDFLDQTHLLPWRKPTFSDHLRSLIKTRRLRTIPRDLTFYCVSTNG